MLPVLALFVDLCLFYCDSLLLLSLFFELLLDSFHLSPLLLHLVHFLVELLLDLHEDSLPLGLSMSSRLHDSLEDLSQLAAKGEQILCNLGLHVEGE